MGRLIGTRVLPTPLCWLPWTCVLVCRRSASLPYMLSCALLVESSPVLLVRVLSPLFVLWPVTVSRSVGLRMLPRFPTIPPGRHTDVVVGGCNSTLVDFGEEV